MFRGSLEEFVLTQRSSARDKSDVGSAIVLRYFQGFSPEISAGTFNNAYRINPKVAQIEPPAQGNGILNCLGENGYINTAQER